MKITPLAIGYMWNPARWVNIKSKQANRFSAAYLTSLGCAANCAYTRVCEMSPVRMSERALCNVCCGSWKGAWGNGRMLWSYLLHLRCFGYNKLLDTLPHGLQVATLGYRFSSKLLLTDKSDLAQIRVWSLIQVHILFLRLPREKGQESVEMLLLNFCSKFLSRLSCLHLNLSCFHLNLVLFFTDQRLQNDIGKC